jgi:alkylated DNA repair protein (DNA oxidative demethylase)
MSVPSVKGSVSTPHESGTPPCYLGRSLSTRAAAIGVSWSGAAADLGSGAKDRHAYPVQSIRKHDARGHDRPTAPPGFLYVANLITPGEERALVEWFAHAAGWYEVKFRGQTARRRAMAFGARYLTQGRRLLPAPRLPPELAAYRDRMVDAACAGLGREQMLAGLQPTDFALCTALHYPSTAGIGWHTDNRAFGPTVLSLSLGAPARLQVRVAADTAAHVPVLEYQLPPRSLFVLAGEARASWQHRIPPVGAERYSFTVRAAAAPGPRATEWH